MNWLPVVERELRVAARRRSTFWIRVGAALTGLVIGGAYLVISIIEHVRPAEMGKILFYMLAWLCLVASLSAGLFFTSDCLSEEKREGTLGLLFLTDLRGYDVMLGKLLATSLRGFYALLAVLPILAITELLGGITGAQYWKSSLALVNGLFFSLAAGMLISALSRDSQKAMAGTLLVILLLAAGGPLADQLIANARKTTFKPFWSLASPGFVLSEAGAWGRSLFWQALLTTEILSWAMFGLSCALVPYTWQDKRRVDARGSGSWRHAWKFGGRRRRARVRTKWLERQPVSWLASLERWQALVLWAMVTLTAGGFIYAWADKAGSDTWMFWNYAGGLFTLLLYLWAASQACRFLVEARRGGMLELLLVSPVTEGQIVGGQWRAMARRFALPVLLLVGAQVAVAALSHLAMEKGASQAYRAAASANAAMAAAATRTNAAARSNFTGSVTTTTVSVSGGGMTVSVAGGTGTNVVAAPRGFQMGSAMQRRLMTIVAAGTVALCTAGNLLAICWFGMWMGLTSRTANLATLKTIVFVQVIPWMLIAFGTAVFMGLVMARSAWFAGPSTGAWWLVWWPFLNALMSTTLALGKDAGFILWSRKKLRTSFRAEASGIRKQPKQPKQPKPALPPPLPPLPPMPPVAQSQAKVA
jgi:hypothetical protein